MLTEQFLNPGRRTAALALTTLALLCSQAVMAQSAAEPAALDQISSLLREKELRSPEQKKLSSQLWYALQSARGNRLPGMGGVYDAATDSLRRDERGNARVKISGQVTPELLAQIRRQGGEVRHAGRNSVQATVPLAALESLAQRPDVQRVAPASIARTNAGALTSQGYISHKANKVVASGYDGSGVRVGVLSDSVDALADLIASGDLPADTVVLPGQSGNPGSSEGSAMMEIVHDVAPGAKLFYATAFNGTTSFADNIRALRDVYHCDIIVDDITYFDEGVFQDDEIAQAVNDVVANGAIYFSSAANSGNLTSGTSGTWEGDFTPGAISAAPLPVGYILHRFGGTQDYNVLTGSTIYISTKWSDALGKSSNDYDMFLLNASGTTILCASTDVQTGTGAPEEACYREAGWPAGTRIVIAKKAGASVRALHLDTQRGSLSIGTAGATFGHNAGASTTSMAATYWNSARTGTRAFVGGAANPTEVFSSDGPRKIFFQPDGTEITPGNLLFVTNGGQTLVKPDFSAADGVSTKTPGFLPFYGTSAAAPHAAGIAALIKSARPDYTRAQILEALRQTALDIRGAGVDRDAGYGLMMAQEAVNYALTH